MKPVRTGLESFITSPPQWLKGHRLGILCNPASVDTAFRHARKLIHDVFPGQIKALFSPQHGFFSEKQDNMVESADRVDEALQIPVYSLYGAARIPDKQMFDAIDTLIVDLQDVGTRVYTYATTISFCLETAKKMDKQVILLDRPNPLGGVAVEGNCLESAVASFVGRYPIPMRHGMTIGELSMMMNQHFGIGCRLTVIPMDGWCRRMYFPDTGLPWVAPSPNLPTFQSAMVYPGQVVWEGTNVSEGRGTTQPFECFGAPYLHPKHLQSFLKEKALHGIVLRETAFEPTSNKWAGSLCRGFQIHVVMPERYKPYETSLFILQAVLSCHEEDFKWKQPPYEYEYETLPIDLIIGSGKIRERIEAKENLEDVIKSWEVDLVRFKAQSKKFYLYT
jgi:uncharacterized protein YbbC (DUF1343 family)